MSSFVLSWFYLYMAIICEVAGTCFIKLSEGFSSPVPSICVLLFYGFSFWLMSLAVRQIDLGIAYVVWSGVGIVAMTLIGFFVFNEPLSYRKIISIAVILAGVISINLA
jgi:small multidrug resistance pump